MDTISSINAAFSQVQRFENLNFSSNGSNTQIGYRERESTSGAGAAGQFGAFRTLPASFLPESANGGVRSAVQNAVNYDRAESGTLMLRTQEGDTVKLKFLNSESYNAQNQQFAEGGSVLTDFSLSMSDASQFKVVVDGDLNGEELTAIREVLVQAREMANSFYSGDVKAAFETAGQFNVNADQLANVNMQFSLREDFTYANAQADVTTPAVTPSNPTLPVAPAVESDPVEQSVASPATSAEIAVPVSVPDVTATAPTTTPSVAPAPVSELVQEAPEVPEPLVTPVNPEPDNTDPLASALNTINSFLSQLTESLSGLSQSLQTPSTSPAFSFTGGFQLQLVGTLIGQLDANSAVEAEEPSGNQLAAATIDVLAMQFDARINITA